MAALDATWWYYLSKFLDMLDSIFFLLHKKFGHLSTLHVVHHGIMPVAVWLGMSRCMLSEKWYIFYSHIKKKCIFYLFLGSCF